MSEEDHFRITVLPFPRERLNGAWIYFALPFVEAETREQEMVSGRGEIEVNGLEAPFGVDIVIRTLRFRLHLCQQQVNHLQPVEGHPDRFRLVVEASEIDAGCGEHHWIRDLPELSGQARIFSHRAEAQRESASLVDQMIEED